MKRSDFEYLQELVKDRSAIVIDSGKEYLAEARLAPLARDTEFESLEELFEHLRHTAPGPLHERVVEAMINKETSFFRDIHPFECFRTQILPELIRRRQAERTLCLWCSASSSGQEPYSIAMILREHTPRLSGWNVRLIASDISEEMLERARTGFYSRSEINRGLRARALVEYFEQEGERWRLKNDIRQMVEFRRINLVGRWPHLPRFDVVFMRNVLIYFDVETKKEILRKVRGLLRPDGYLFLGGSETTLNLDDAFERVRFEKTVCYRLKSSTGG